MPVADHATHPKTIMAPDHKYQCHNRPHQFRPVCHGSDAYGTQLWPFRNSHECRYDMSLQDKCCTGCQHQGSGEAYSRSVA